MASVPPCSRALHQSFVTSMQGRRRRSLLPARSFLPARSLRLARRGSAPSRRSLTAPPLPPAAACLQTLRAHAVVCTLPLGCLQHGGVSFEPPLPGAASPCLAPILRGRSRASERGRVDQDSTAPLYLLQRLSTRGAACPCRLPLPPARPPSCLCDALHCLFFFYVLQNTSWRRSGGWAWALRIVWRCCLTRFGQV